MKTTYDKELAVEISEAFVAALHAVIRADLASAGALTFEFGGDDDKPEGMEGVADVVVFNARLGVTGA